MIMVLNEIRNRWWCFAWLSAGIIILFWKLDDIVGLHRDEAVFGLFAEMILDGARPLYGFFNNYTSPVHAYLLAAVIKIFGNSIWSLRCLGPVFTLITIVAIFDIVRQFSIVRARWAACFLLTYPPLVMLSRLCGEVFVLNPFLFFGTIWVYVKFCRSQKQYLRTTGFILAGFLLSLGIWNHVIFLPSAAALVICYAIFMWPGLRQLLINSGFCSLGFLIGLIPRFISMLLFGNILFPKTPSVPPATLTSALLNLLYTFSGDGFYARFSGGSAIPFAWVMPGFLVIVLVTFCFLRRNQIEKKLFWGIWVFLLFNFIGIWRISPFGSIGSRVWLIPVWIIPVLFGIWMADLNARKWRIVGCIVISINLMLLVVNYYIPNSLSHGVISPSVYIGGKYDNTWDYYDHRQIVKKLLQTDNECIFISNINVFTFFYLTPEDQRHRIKLLWPLESVSSGSTPEKIKLYKQLSYKGPMPKSPLFVFYDNDMDYLDTFSKQWFYPMTAIDKDINFPGFKVFRLK